MHAIPLPFRSGPPSARVCRGYLPALLVSCTTWTAAYEHIPNQFIRQKRRIRSVYTENRRCIHTYSTYRFCMVVIFAYTVCNLCIACASLFPSLPSQTCAHCNTYIYTYILIPYIHTIHNYIEQQNQVSRLRRAGDNLTPHSWYGRSERKVVIQNCQCRLGRPSATTTTTTQ